MCRLGHGTEFEEGVIYKTVQGYGKLARGGDTSYSGHIQHRSHCHSRAPVTTLAVREGHCPCSLASGGHREGIPVSSSSLSLEQEPAGKGAHWYSPKSASVAQNRVKKCPAQ